MTRAPEVEHDWTASVGDEFTAVASRLRASAGDTALAFTERCVRAAAELALGDAAADRPLAALERDVLAAVAEQPTTALAYAADVFALARGRRPDEWGAPQATDAALRPTVLAIAANLGFVVAHMYAAVAAESGGDYARAFEDERERQCAWLRERLGLD